MANPDLRGGVAGRAGLGPPVSRRRPVLALALMASLPMVTACSAWSSSMPDAERTATIVPPNAGADARAAPPAMPSTGVYPSVSLVDLFTSGAAPARTAGVPHPPATYTPVGEPYIPPAGQAGYGQASAAASDGVSSSRDVPAATAPSSPGADAASAMPYPQQSLVDALFNKPAQ